MTNLQLVFPEIFLSLSIMFLLILCVFKKNNNAADLELICKFIDQSQN